jgi:hypothetical protein
MAAVLRWRPQRWWFLIVWCLAWALILEFSPLQLRPRYVPIHRLPRFLHALGLPSAVIIGAALTEALRRRHAIAITAIVLWSAYAATSLSASISAAARHADAMIDQRFVAQFTRRYSRPVVADGELINFLNFAHGYRDDDIFHPLGTDVSNFPPGTLVVLGGGRRIDLDPAYVAALDPKVLPQAWLKIADMPGARAPGRLIPGALYIVVAGLDSRTDSAFAQMIGNCPPRVNWALRDFLDVGDRESESSHAYFIEGSSWEGRRTLLNAGDFPLVDDGRAFRKSQRLVLSKLEDNSDVCVAVRIDSSVQHQVSRWSVGGWFTQLDTGMASVPNRWQTKTLIVPGDRIRDGRLELRETFVSSAVDINVFRIEAYQRAPMGRD